MLIIKGKLITCQTKQIYYNPLENWKKPAIKFSIESPIFLDFVDLSHFVKDCSIIPVSILRMVTGAESKFQSYLSDKIRSGFYNFIGLCPKKLQIFVDSSTKNLDSESSWMRKSAKLYLSRR